MEKEIAKVEVTQEKIDEAKVKIEQAKETIKNNKKDYKHFKVVINGLSEVEAQAVNTVLHHIESTKNVPNQHIQNITKQLETIEEDLDLFGHIEKELNVYNNTSRTYRDVIKRIENITKYREYLENQVKPIKAQIDYADETITKIRSYIVERKDGDTVYVDYNAEYLRPMLDLAYVIFDLVPTEDGGVELKSKVKE